MRCRQVPSHGHRHVTVPVTTAARPAARPGRAGHGNWHRDSDTALPGPSESFGGRFRVRVGPLLRSATSFQPASLQRTPGQWQPASEPAPGPSGLVRASSSRVRDSESRGGVRRAARPSATVNERSLQSRPGREHQRPAMPMTRLADAMLTRRPHDQPRDAACPAGSRLRITASRGTRARARARAEPVTRRACRHAAG